MVAQIKMPALSPTMTEGKLSKWLIQKSSKVVSGDVIAEIETDKATMEIEAVDDGVLYEIFVEEGTDNVAVGSTLALIKEDNDTEERPAFLLFIAAGSGIGAAILGGMIIFGSKEED